MSLRDLGVFAPLPAMHPLVRNGHRCFRCNRTLAEGVRTALMPVETAEQAGGLTVRAEPVCATCHLYGQDIATYRDRGRKYEGRRIVERVKDGDGSPFPVLTFGGEQWRDDEVGP